MTAYAFWNNKGGVGKSYLSFICACEYAHRHPESDIYVIDLCPQGNVSEILFGSDKLAEKLSVLLKAPIRRTVGGYIESRLSSPFIMIPSVEEYISHPMEVNKNIPSNVYLVAGDYILEILSEAMRQASQLSIPLNAWRQVVTWIRDLVSALRRRSGFKESQFIIDCNPSFAIYTQMAIAAADQIIVPFTADDSSRRAIENILALVFGLGDPKLSAYARLSFAQKALDEGVSIPKLHTFVSNRVTMYEGKPSRAFELANNRVKDTVENIYKDHRGSFAFATRHPSTSFIEIPDYHSACIVSSLTGTPVHKLRPGPKEIEGQRIQINKDPLDKYKTALSTLVDRL